MGAKETDGMQGSIANRPAGVLKELYEGSKNIYQISKGMRKRYPNESIYYETVLKAVGRAEELGYVIQVGEGKRKSKIYGITLHGLAILYGINAVDSGFDLKEGESGFLQFHRSKKGQEIVEKIIQYFIKKYDFDQTPEMEFFYRTLKCCPSSISFFIDSGDTMEPPKYKSGDIYKKLGESLNEFLSTSNNFFFIKKTKSRHDDMMEFYSYEFPVIHLTIDVFKYNDDELWSTLLNALIRRRAHQANMVTEEIEYILSDFFKQVKEEKIDPKKSIANQMKTYLNDTVRKKYTEDCWSQWYIYIPPSTNPIPEIYCKGNCKGKCLLLNRKLK